MRNLHGAIADLLRESGLEVKKDNTSFTNYFVRHPKAGDLGYLHLDDEWLIATQVFMPDLRLEYNNPSMIDALIEYFIADVYYAEVGPDGTVEICSI